MNKADVFYKTHSGLDEVRTRERKLPPRLRTLLIMVDGVMSAHDLQAAAIRLGAPDDALQSLLELDLIAIRPRTSAAAHSAHAQQGSASTSQRPADAARQPPAVGSVLPADGADKRQRFDAAKKLMNDTAVDVLGLRAFFFTLKLEKCFGLDDLRALMPEYEKILAKGGQDEATDVLLSRLKEYLGTSA